MGAGSWSDMPVDIEELLQTLFTLAILLFVGGNLTAWRQPARIVLLRPFNRAATATALRRLIKLYVRFYGHIYTLADVDIRGGASFLRGKTRSCGVGLLSYCHSISELTMNSISRS